MALPLPTGPHLVLATQSLAPAGEWAVPLDTWAFVRVLGGIGYLLQRAGPRDLRAGEVIVVRGGATAVFRASQLGQLDLATFHVNLRSAAGVLSPPELRRVELLAAQEPRKLRCFAPEAEVAQLFAELTDLQDEAPAIGLRCRMLEIFGLVVADELGASGGPAQPMRQARERLEQAIRSIADAELQERSAAELARRCGCSERHFSRLFRGLFGRSVRARQIELRLEKAQQLLRESDAKVAEVARASGYRHLGLFHAVFKQRFGVSPSRWRVRDRRTRGRDAPAAAPSDAPRAAA